MILTTTDSVPGRQIAEVLGIVRGSYMHGSATILSSFTDPRRVEQMLDELREDEDRAFEQLTERAKELGADAVIGLRIAPDVFEYDNALKHRVIIYGTAVKLA